MNMPFALADWLVFLTYGLLLLVTGWYFNRQKAASTQEYFLAAKQMPIWVVAISVLATSQSAATFLGGPDQGYRGDFSYLASNIGAFIAAIIVAVFFIPKFYDNKVATVYELLEKKFGAKAKQQAGYMYLFGRIFASGARLYMAAIAVSMILFMDIDAEHVVLSTLVLVIIGLGYSVIGGIRTVIYSDVIQCFIYITAAIAVIAWLLTAIPADFSTIVEALKQGNGNGSKLTLIDTSWDMSASGVFNIYSCLTGFVLLNIAAFALDQDLTQRVLTCKSAKDGSKAILFSVLMVIPVMALFIFIGMLLFVFYQRPDLMNSSVAGDIEQTFSGEKITIFMYYVLNEIPAGIKGLVTIGVIAAALSTLNSGLNSMSSVLVQDIYRPWRLKQHANNSQSEPSPKHFVKAGQVGMLLVAIALGSMAILCYFWQKYSDMPLLAFALSVMVFSYSGLLGVYFTTLFTNRGNQFSIPAALICGFLITLLCQPYVMQLVLPESWQFQLGFTWQLCLGTLVSFLVCVSGSQQPVPTLVEAKS